MSWSHTRKWTLRQVRGYLLEHHHQLANLYRLLTEAHQCEHLAQNRYMKPEHYNIMTRYDCPMSYVTYCSPGFVFIGAECVLQHSSILPGSPSNVFHHPSFDKFGKLVQTSNETGLIFGTLCMQSSNKVTRKQERLPPILKMYSIRAH